MHANMMMDRRAMLQRAMLIVAGTSVAGHSKTLAAAGKTAAEPLTPAQFNLYSAVAGTIVPKTDTPGAVEVGAPKLFDGLLRKWASPERRAALVGALEAIDKAAREQMKKGFSELPESERATFLEAYDTNALKPVPRTDGATGFAAMMTPSFADPAYAKLKELTIILYYYSEPALTQELSYEHAPGQWQPSIPVTADTRPAGGPSFL